MINILIRTCGRRELFLRCLESVYAQNYPDLRVIVSVDRDGIDYVPDGIEVIRVTPGPEEYYYDKYCNDLKALVTDGWFLFLDDDDVLAPECLSKLRLDAPAILVQLNHMGNILPASADIRMGLIGMPCLILHHSLKDLAYFTGEDHGDYHYIKQVADKVELKFQELVVVVSDRKGNGISQMGSLPTPAA